MGGDSVGPGGLFLHLIDNCNCRLDLAVDAIIEAAREAAEGDDVAAQKVLREKLRAAGETLARPVIREIRDIADHAPGNTWLDIARACDVVLSWTGDYESRMRVAGHLLRMTHDDDDMPSPERRYRLQQALGWLALSVGAIDIDNTSMSTSGVAMSVGLLGYHYAKSAGVEHLDRRLLNEVTDGEEPIGFGQRYHESELIGGLTTTIFDAHHSHAYSHTDQHPGSVAGVIARRITERVPNIEYWCNRVIENPANPAAIRELIDALRDQLIDSREEQEELNRCLAQFGDRQALFEAAGWLMRRAYHVQRDAHVRGLVQSILGMLALASGARPLPEGVLDRPSGAFPAAQDAGDFVIKRIEKVAVEQAKQEQKTSEARSDSHAKSDTVDEFDFKETAEELKRDLDAAAQSRDQNFNRRGYVTVIRSIGNEESREGKQVKAEFGSLLSAIKLAELPFDIDVADVRTELISEFPHAEMAIEAIVGDQSARHQAGEKSIHFRPTLFVGRPGCGKSRLARQIAHAFGLPHRMHPAAGIADSMFAGLARGWHGGHGCAPLDLIRLAKKANPVLILDEIDKAATGKRNGNLVDSLLPMLEQETAAAWTDPYIQAPVNLSFVNWLFTANEVKDLPSPFRDRVRIVEVPSPSLEHIPSIAQSIVNELRPVGQRVEMIPDLDGAEMAILLEHWQPNMSVRALQRMIQTLLAARDQIAARH